MLTLSHLGLAFQGQPLSDEASAALGLMIIGIVLLVGIGIQIVVCAILYSAARRLPVEYQLLSPGLVWLLLIPLFNLVWNFIVFLRLPDGYRACFAAQGRAAGDCGRTLGMWYATLSAVCTVGSLIPILGCIFALGSIAALVLLIIFLVKISTLKHQIGMMPAAPAVSTPPPAPPVQG